MAVYRDDPDAVVPILRDARWLSLLVGVAWLLSGVASVAVANLSLRRALGRRVGQARPRVAEIARLARVSVPLAGTILIKFGGLGVVTFAAGLTSTRDTAAQAVQGIGLTALKRSGASLGYFAAGYGLLVLSAVPVAVAWGIDGLWVSLVVVNVLLAGLQGVGFHRHSARVGEPGMGTIGA